MLETTFNQQGDKVTVQEKLQDALDDALRVYKADKATGDDALSTAWNAGRVDGLKQALDILEGKKS